MYPQLSIVIPVYNVEKYIEDCIKSVLNQNYSNFELILIDDGSTDNSREVCQKYIELDSRVTLIVQENLGVSTARNIGISKASGQYIMFIDGDDMLQKDTLNTLMSNSENNDMISFPIFTLTEDNVLKTYLTYSNQSIAIQKIMEKNFKEKNLFIWGRIYRLQVVKDNRIYFDTKLYYAEDMEWLTRLIPFLQKASCVSCGGYIYRKNRINSAMTNMYAGKNSDYFINAINAYNTGFSNLKSFGDPAAICAYKMKIVHLRRFIFWMLNNRFYTNDIIKQKYTEFFNANIDYIRMRPKFKEILFIGKNFIFFIKFIIGSKKKCKQSR